MLFSTKVSCSRCRNDLECDLLLGAKSPAFGTTGGQRIQAVQSVVKEMLIDESLVNIESQRQQVERLIKVIHRNNATILPAILNPVPLIKSRGLQGGVRISPDDSLFVLLYCIRCIARVPGAQALLEERFGKNPSYNL